MTATIHTHTRWANAAATVAGLEQQGFAVVRENPLAGLVMMPVMYGETVVGTMTRDEAALYRTHVELAVEVDRIDRAIQGTLMKTMGEKIEGSDPKTGTSIVVDRSELSPPMEAEPRREYFAKRQTAGFLFAALHYYVGERLGLHDAVLGFRANGQIVRVAARSEGQ